MWIPATSLVNFLQLCAIGSTKKGGPRRDGVDRIVKGYFLAVVERYHRSGHALTQLQGNSRHHPSETNSHGILSEFRSICAASRSSAENNLPCYTRRKGASPSDPAALSQSCRLLQLSFLIPSWRQRKHRQTS